MPHAVKSPAAPALLRAQYAEFREAVEGNHQDHRIRNLLVRDIMSSPLVSVERTASVADVVNLMLKKNISSVPVLDGGRLAGIVTRVSLVNAL